MCGHAQRTNVSYDRFNSDQALALLSGQHDIRLAGTDLTDVSQRYASQLFDLQHLTRGRGVACVIVT